MKKTRIHDWVRVFGYKKRAPIKRPYRFGTSNQLVPFLHIRCAIRGESPMNLVHNRDGYIIAQHLLPK